MALNIGDLYARIFLEDKLSGGLDQAGKKMQGFGRSMLPMSAALGALGGLSMKFATDLNASMANVATLIPKSTERVLELKEEVQSLAVATGKSSSDIAGGLYQVISAFEDTADTVKILEINARAATAGLATTEEAIALTSAVTKGYGDTTAEAVQKAADLAFVTVKMGQTTFPELAEAIGKVTPIAAALGVTQEELFAGFATLTGVIPKTAEVSTGLKGIMASMLKPTEEMKQAMLDFGYSSVDAMIAEEGLVGSMRGLLATTDGSKEAIAELFANVEALPAVFALTEGQADSFDKKFAVLGDTVGAVDVAFAEITQGVNASGFAFTQMKEQLRGAAEDFGDKLLPIVTEFALAVIPPLLSGLGDLIDAFGELPEWLQIGVVGFGAFVVAAGPVIYVLGTMTTAAGALAGALSVGLFVVLGKVAAALAVGWATYAFTTWLIDIILPTKEWKNALYDTFLQLTAIGPVLAAYNAHMEKSRGGVENMTAADRALHEEWVRGTAARAAATAQLDEAASAFSALEEEMLNLTIAQVAGAEASDVLAEAQKGASAITNESIIAAVRAAEADTVLKAASDLLGKEITDLAEAERILKIATENSAEAIEAQRQKAALAARDISGLTEAVEGMGEAFDVLTRIEIEQWFKSFENLGGMGEAARMGAEGMEHLAREAKEAQDALEIPLSPLAEAAEAADALAQKIQAVTEGLLIFGNIFGGVFGDLSGVLSTSIQGFTQMADKVRDNNAAVADGTMSAAAADAEKLAMQIGLVANAAGMLGDMLSGSTNPTIQKLGGALQGAAAGAKMGSAFGPWGAAIGGVVGGIAGFIKSSNAAEMATNDLRDAFFESQGGFEEFSRSMAEVSDEDWAKKIFDASTVEEFNALVREAQGLLDTQGAAQDALNDAVERYGFTIEELGPAMQRQELEDMAGQLLTDWKLLIASGIDIGTVVERMGGNMVDFVEKSLAAGQDIPIAMKPMIDQLIASGQLLDENGEAFTSAEDAGITFAQTMSEQFSSLIEKIDAMVNALLGIDDIDVSPTVHIPNVDGPNVSIPDGRGDSPDFEAQSGFFSSRMPTGPRPGGATDIRVHPGERVDISPGGEGSSSEVVNINMSINENPYQSAEGQEQLRRYTLRAIERDTGKRLAALVRAGRA